MTSATNGGVSGIAGSESGKQIDVLKRMSESGQLCSTDPRQYQIHELAMLVGTDEREILRSLYILEGHKYVAPFPAGDFTSKTWHITHDGLRALKEMNGSMASRAL